MSPTLSHGMSVLYNPTSTIKDRDIILLRHPHKEDLILIKRCTKQESQRFWVEGDNRQESTDSRHFGWVPHHCYMGTVTSII